MVGRTAQLCAAHWRHLSTNFTKFALEAPGLRFLVYWALWSAAPPRVPVHRALAADLPPRWATAILLPARALWVRPLARLCALGRVQVLALCWPALVPVHGSTAQPRLLACASQPSRQLGD